MIQHDHLPRPQGRPQRLREVPVEGRRLHRPLDRLGHAPAVGGQCHHQRGVPAVVARHRSGRPLVVGRPAREPCQGDMRAAFVDKDEPLGVELGNRLAPSGACLLVALARCQRLFFCVQPRRCRARHIVASLTCCPWCSAHQAQCSSTVASGAASSRAQDRLLLAADRAWATRNRLARARPSHAVARRRASPWSPPPYSGERLLAGADRPPPLAPSVLSGRSNRHACPSAQHVSCLPLFSQGAVVAAIGLPPMVSCSPV